MVFFNKSNAIYGNSKFKRISRLFDSTDYSQNWTNTWSEEYMFSIKEINSLINDSTNFNSSLKSEWNKIDSIDIHNYEKISLFDLEHYLTDNLLYKVDIA